MAVFSPSEIDLLRGTWDDDIAEDTPGCSVLFSSSTFWVQIYEKLLTDHPDLGNVIPSVEHQTVAFASLVCTALDNLEDLGRMDEYLMRLGRVHARVVNVKKRYFEAMGVAIIDVLELRAMPVQQINLWGRLYEYLSSKMYQGGLNPPVISDEMNRSPDPTFFMEDLKRPTDNASVSDSSSSPNSKTAFSIADDQTSDDSTDASSVVSFQLDNNYAGNGDLMKKRRSHNFMESKDRRNFFKWLQRRVQ